ncbi:MAG: N-acetyltransferase [gamma proteobacterium endosymbiont of Lamellibrachia anaximandri]|nr:N-acetyltransferase [gamma proteobacterium endosymbiont of Lamellibrachia anaximandri]
MSIRAEEKSDIDGIWKVNTEAFETKEEANIVNALRNSGVTNISLVYEKNNELGGHILFTPVELIGDTSGLKLMGLAPMAVIPNLQNKGIGSSLIKSGIQQCIDEGYGAVVVLGHQDYYPKFGFVPSVKYGIKSEYDVPDDVFMVLELKENALKGKQGTIKYHEAFGSV